MKTTAESHAVRCSTHFEQAELISSSSSAWAAVAYFYSAYHAMKRAFIEDPVFDDMGALKKLDVNLMPEDRYTTRHKVRSGGSGFGVNSIVQLLYPGHIKAYDTLHQASIRVRYDGKPPVQELAVLRQHAVTIKESVSTGLMRCSPL